MPRFLQFVVPLTMALLMVTAGVPMQAKVPPRESRCCLLVKQDGCDQMPVNGPEKAQCCAACVVCVALPAEATAPFVYASTGEENFGLLRVRAHARADRPEIPPPRTARS